jgi:hypothetical protein
MDDLMETLKNFLNTEEGKQKLNDVAAMLNGGDSKNELGALSSLLGGTEKKNTEPSEGGLDLGGLDLNMLLKAKELMSNFQGDDKNTQLIKALKPHLKPERQKKADEAMRLMKLIEMLPLIQKSGLFGGESI